MTLFEIVRAQNEELQKDLEASEKSAAEIRETARRLAEALSMGATYIAGEGTPEEIEQANEAIGLAKKKGLL